MTGTSIGWGILGTGRIARLFAPDVRLVPGHRLAAVGSRDAARARAFAGALSIPGSHGSYADLVADPEVDVVYVATPHPAHRDACLLALDAGKAVLCEKPFAMTAAEAAEVAAAARVRDRFAMEGMWTRFFPAMTALRRWLDEGAIGEVTTLHAGFGFRAPWDPDDRLLNRELGGGALLDLGVYAVSLAHFVLGPPAEVTALAEYGATGVDETTTVLLRAASGALATLSCSLRTELPTEATVCGSRGRIGLGDPFWRPTRLRLQSIPDPDAARARASPSWRDRLGAELRVQSQRLSAKSRTAARLLPPLKRFGKRLLGVRTERTAHFRHRGHGFHYEIAEVGRCLREGLRESPLMPLDETVAVMRTLDRVAELTQRGIRTRR